MNTHRRIVFVSAAEGAARARERARVIADDLRQATAQTVRQRDCSTIEVVFDLCATLRDFSIGRFPNERARVASEMRSTANAIHADSARSGSASKEKMP